MVCSVLTIIFAVISFFHPWFFIGSTACLILAVVEFIVEITVSEMFVNEILSKVAIVLGACALVIGIVALIVALIKINKPVNSPEVEAVVNLLFNNR